MAEGTIKKLTEGFGFHQDGTIKTCISTIEPEASFRTVLLKAKSVLHRMPESKSPRARTQADIVRLGLRQPSNKWLRLCRANGVSRCPNRGRSKWSASP